VRDLKNQDKLLVRIAIINLLNPYRGKDIVNVISLEPMFSLAIYTKSVAYFSDVGSEVALMMRGNMPDALFSNPVDASVLAYIDGEYTAGVMFQKRYLQLHINPTCEDEKEVFSEEKSENHIAYTALVV